MMMRGRRKVWSSLLLLKGERREEGGKGGGRREGGRGGEVERDRERKNGMFSI